MKPRLKKLDNGLRVITTEIPTSESATITVWVGVGSRSEEDKIAGLSHFIEHVVFKGSVKYPNPKIVAETIDGLGGEFNAATSKEWTNFYLKSRAANLTKSFDLLADVVLNPLLDSREIEREKGVITEEIAMYEDTPLFHIPELFYNLIYQNDNLGRDIYGSRESVVGLKRDDFTNYRKIHYYSDNIVVSVAGGVTENEVVSLAAEYFGALKETGKSEENFFNFSPNQKKPRVLLQSKRSDQAHIVMGFYAGKRGNRERYVEAILATILGGGMSSRLFTEVREKRGLAYAVKTGVERYFDTGELSSYAGIKVGKIEEAIKVMVDQYYGLASGKYPITQAELNRAKELIKGQLALALEDSKEVNNLFGESELLLAKIDTPKAIYAGIDKVTKEEVVAVAKKLFVPERLNLAIIGPYKDQSKFEKLLK